MSVIKVSKKPEDMDEVMFLKEALKELQREQKGQRKSFIYDIEQREIAIRNKKQT